MANLLKKLVENEKRELSRLEKIADKVLSLSTEMEKRQMKN